MNTVVTHVDTGAVCPLASREATLKQLAQWAEIGALNEIDVAFARFLARETPDAEGLLLLAAALASHRLASGHVCLDLAATLAAPDAVLSLDPEEANAGREYAPVAALADVLEHVTLARWQEALAHDDPVGEGPGSTPLVLAGARLYLRRYWQYEQGVCRALGERAARLAQQTSELSESGLRAALDLLFPPHAQHGDAATPDWQKLACALAARSAFAIVTGGPGTGKTTTVVKLLALLQALALEAGNSGQPLRIRLAAPTGKAAARLNASIAGAIERLPLAAFRHGDAVRANIPTDVVTLHRLLGKRPDSRHFRHGPGQLLPLDVLVIDEASMVDLEMMHGVLVALPPHAQLILLGDKDQLASVEAGAVLGELCARAHAGHYTRQTRDWLARVTGEVIDDALVDPTGSELDQSIAMLRVSHRFDAQSGIGKLAEAVNRGDASAVEAIWAGGHAEIAKVSLPRPSAGEAALKALLVDGTSPGGPGPSSVPGRRGYRHYLETIKAGQPRAESSEAEIDGWARAVLEAHGEFQVLCALRRGEWGVEGLNRQIERRLQDEGLIEPVGEWYAGRPVIVRRNDYALGLMNGDIGITLSLPASDGSTRLRVAFASSDGSERIKWVSPSRLQSVETVFALTVHKAQGSEFTHAALVLPDAMSPVLTRELVYTGITRARDYLTIASADLDAMIEQAIEACTQRASGLRAQFY